MISRKAQVQRRARWKASSRPEMRRLRPHEAHHARLEIRHLVGAFARPLEGLLHLERIHREGAAIRNAMGLSGLAEFVIDHKRAPAWQLQFPAKLPA